MRILLLSALLIVIMAGLMQAQLDAQLIDEFGAASNDDLMARMDNFWNQLKDKDSLGVVVLSGTQWQKHLNRRRIEGCNHWSRWPLNALRYIFTNEPTVKVQLWSVPKETKDPRFQERSIDYSLPELIKPIELSTSQATDEYCPRMFDVELYSKFMAANPSFKGKVVIDMSRRQFIRRVIAHRQKLKRLQVDPHRVVFYRHRFYHESDEQWWLIPPKKK